MEKPTAYLEVLDQAGKMAKADLLLSTVPLGLLFSQSALLLENDVLALKVLITIAVFSLLYATYLAWSRSVLVTLFFTKETLCQDGTPAKGERGRVYLDYALSGTKLSPDSFDEETLVSTGKQKFLRHAAALSVGYVATIAAFLVLVWM